ncbi:MAG: hypothetical protein KU37_06290 [Sulfuricurvum sp. PC08-66]|nr:MAG: hypothetical protein KU37_06290 [Sulfuricurvum sp. PC08-66]
MTLLSKYHYEKIWRPTPQKELERIIAQELPDADISQMCSYIMEECAKGKSVRLIDIAFKKA